MFYEYDSIYFDWSNIEKYDNWLYVFDKLPKRMRLTVDLRVSGMMPKEIAEVMAISVGTVKQHLNLAKFRVLRGAKLI